MVIPDPAAAEPIYTAMTDNKVSQGFFVPLVNSSKTHGDVVGRRVEPSTSRRSVPSLPSAIASQPAALDNARTKLCITTMCDIGLGFD